MISLRSRQVLLNTNKVTKPEGVEISALSGSFYIIYCIISDTSAIFPPNKRKASETETKAKKFFLSYSYITTKRPIFPVCKSVDPGAIIRHYFGGSDDQDG